MLQPIQECCAPALVSEIKFISFLLHMIFFLGILVLAMNPYRLLLQLANEATVQ